MLNSLILAFCFLIPQTDPVWGDAKTDQEKCQAEADYMAKHNKLCHVGKCIGRFEGVGWSYRGNPKPNTCTDETHWRCHICHGEWHCGQSQELEIKFPSGLSM